MTIYVRLDFSDANKAMQAVWEDEDQAGEQRTAFSSSSVGMASVWTNDDTRTQAFIVKLEELQLPFSVDDKQQVTTWLDSMFHK